MEWTSLLSDLRIKNLADPGSASKRDDERRSEFERDYDRAIFCTPVRRLADKAQVFPLESHDAVRTRLTHSLEVATVARGLSSRVAQWLEREHGVSRQQACDISTIAATCGLIHDLGNPPFGHAGETAIAEWFQQRDKDFWGEEMDGTHRSDFESFEGNAQTIRLLSKLQILVDPFGLNLTCGTLSAACKYTANSAEVDKKRGHEFSKPGYFQSETELIEQVRGRTGTGAARNPITYLVEACDDMVYGSVDLEDAVKKGVVRWADLRERLLDEDSSDGVKGCLAYAEERVAAGQLGVEGIERDEVLTQFFRTAVIGKAVESSSQTFRKKYDLIMSGEYHGELIKDGDAASLVGACKTVGRALVYPAGSTPLLEVRGREVLHDLLTLFTEGVSNAQGTTPPGSFEGKIFGIMSANYRRVFKHAWKEKKLPPQYLQLQLVTDYVCGMTDTFACSLHRQLKNG